MQIHNILIFSLMTGYCIANDGIQYNEFDSLKKNSFTSLSDKIEDSKNNKFLQRHYLKAFLDKAKSDNNILEIINGYKGYMYYYEDKPSIVYADSMIEASLKSNDNSLIGSAYLTKGIVHYSQKEYKQALDQYLIASEYISKTNNDYLKYKTKYNIAHIKYYLGGYKKAIVLFDECIDYFKENNTRGYLNTLHSLALCHNRIGNFGSSSELNNKGIAEGKRLNDSSMEHYFIHLEGINDYFRSNYSLAIEKIEESLIKIRANKDFANEAVGYFYIGKSYLGLRQEEKAMRYFELVVQIFDEKEYIRPDLREGYEHLIKHYKAKGNVNLKLHYIHKLMKADSILNTNYKYLIEKILVEYDTAELQKEVSDFRKDKERGERKDKLMLSGIILLVLSLLLVSYRYLLNKKLYKQRFEELMDGALEKPIAIKKNQVTKLELDINPEAADQLIKQLEKFEKNMKFLEKDLTSVKLAAAFNSNTKYLSKVILYSRGKKFGEYINDLKIDYIIEVLKNNRKVRNYTNKSLAEEAGFSSTQRFTSAFVSRTGISPTFFIEELRRQEK